MEVFSYSFHIYLNIFLEIKRFRNITMKIELVNPIPELVETYEDIIYRAIKQKLITLKEWNSRFKYFRDDTGYSFIHLLEGKMSGQINYFLTENPIMIENRNELEKRFKIKIMNMKEFAYETKKTKKNKRNKA